MKILLIEDDAYKLNNVVNYLESISDDMYIDTGGSVAKGVSMALNNSYDLLLLDMTIPNFESNKGQESGMSYKNGGEYIIRELLEEDINFRCAIITQYETFNNETIDEISQRIDNLCKGKYYGYVKYSTMDEQWKNELKNLIADVKNSIN